jgi:hypothetical protein
LEVAMKQPTRQVYILTQILGYGQLTEKEIFRGVFSTYDLAKKAEDSYKKDVRFSKALFNIAAEELNVARKVW